MLNIFPTLLDYGLFAPFIVRLTLGLIFIRFGVLSLSGDRHRLINSIKSWGVFFPESAAMLLGAIEFIAGVLLVLGLFTQIAALVAGLISLKLIVAKLLGKPFGTEGVLFDLVLLTIAISLLFSGAGFLAFDLPL